MNASVFCFNQTLHLTVRRFLCAGFPNPQISKYRDELTESYAYDANGRIIKKKRNSALDWIYEYYENRHQLKEVTNYHDGADQKPNYEYDKYGNMTIDRSKNMLVTYDYRNLPLKFQFFEDVDARVGVSSSVDMVYDAGGNRVLKTERLPLSSGEYNTKSTLYSGGFIYKAEANELLEPQDYKLAYYNMSGGEGRVNIKGDGSIEKSYVYLKDHLGSTRMTLDDQSEVVESDIFTAYGEELQLDQVGDQETTEKFTGKELDRDGWGEKIRTFLINSVDIVTPTEGASDEN